MCDKHKWELIHHDEATAVWGCSKCNGAKTREVGREHTLIKYYKYLSTTPYRVNAIKGDKSVVVDA